MGKKGITQEDKARIMGAVARQNGGKIPKNSWACKLQSFADKAASKKP
ncbi:MAG: hypothetical protein ACOCRK_05590 [bacterium]